MCLICADLQRGALTSQEALRNYWEMVDQESLTQGTPHAEKVVEEIYKLLETEAAAEGHGGEEDEPISTTGYN